MSRDHLTHAFTDSPDSPAREEFVDEDSQRPAIRSEVVSSVHDDFRSHVLRGPTERPGFLPDTDVFSETEICLQIDRGISRWRILLIRSVTDGLYHLHVALRIQKEVLGFQVPVDDAQRVQVVERL